MARIKTVSAEQDDRVRRAVEAQRTLYAIEYAEPIHPRPDGTPRAWVIRSIIASCSKAGEHDSNVIQTAGGQRHGD